MKNKPVCSYCEGQREWTDELTRLGFNVSHTICNEHLVKEYEELGMTQEEIREEINNLLN